MRGHVAQRAHSRLEEGVDLAVLGESEVCDFEDFVLDEYVCGFKVAVYDAALEEFAAAVEDLDEVLHDLLLLELAVVPVFFEQVEEGAAGG